MGPLESRIGRGVSARGDQCMDHAVSAMLTCKAAWKALSCPEGSGVEGGVVRRNSIVFTYNCARDGTEECALNGCAGWWIHRPMSGWTCIADVFTSTGSSSLTFESDLSWLFDAAVPSVSHQVFPLFKLNVTICLQSLCRTICVSKETRDLECDSKGPWSGLWVGPLTPKQSLWGISCMI